MSSHIRFIVIPAILVAALSSSGQQGTVNSEQVCTHQGLFVGPCFTVRGRMYAANGSPSYRIWVVGTKRILGVHEGVGVSECVTPALLDSLIGIEDKLVYADFVVRPVTPDRPGSMRMVCIASARRIATRPAYFINPPPK